MKRGVLIGLLVLFFLLCTLARDHEKKLKVGEVDAMDANLVRNHEKKAKP